MNIKQQKNEERTMSISTTSSASSVASAIGGKRKLKIVPKKNFTEQSHRKDVLQNMISNTHLTGKELFDLIMTDYKNVANEERRQGLIFECLCQILIALKCFGDLIYSEVYYGQLQNPKKMTNMKTILDVKIEGGGNNIVDMTIKKENTTILFSIKYRNKYSETDVSKIYSTITMQKITDDYKIGLVVKDKEVFINHKYINDLNIDKQIHDTIRENGLLFDEKDVIKALDVFCQRFSCNKVSIDDFIDFINADYLLSSRKQLILKLHQYMTLQKFIHSFSTNKNKIWCISHKPRSGKSITLLLICKYILEHEGGPILLMTSVTHTIDSFVKDLEEYIDFKNVKYMRQDEMHTVDDKFHGIVFCSVQFLKIDGKTKIKKELLKNIGFRAIITDESHQGSSTDKTKKEILDVNSDDIVDDISKNIKIKIFASGTADKTIRYYRINSSYVYEWELFDESCMNNLIKCKDTDTRDNHIKYMCNRHGEIFKECLENEALNKDYSKSPVQMLMKGTISKELINVIKAYNTKNVTNYGYNCSSMFALLQHVNAKKEVKYVEEFELCKSEDGNEMLKSYFNNIISNEPNEKNTIMKQIEEMQTIKGSRRSTTENPLLHIIYLPTHTGNNTISLLQKTMKSFLEKNNLWSQYNIEYSNSQGDSSNIKEQSYNEFIKSIMTKTKKDGKRGCILLLGNKGSVGITYDDCDVTISFDDGHNMDNQKQKNSRALTAANGKTIGINVDMNIQRTYKCVLDVIQKYRKNTNTAKTNAEILYYLFTQNIFLFDLQNINNGQMKTCEIKSYYEKEAENIMKEIDDTHFLEDLICEEDYMKDLIKIDIQQRAGAAIKKANKDLEGEHQDCPKGDKSKVEIDSPKNSDSNEAAASPSEYSVKEIILINKTCEICKNFLLPLFALISLSYNIFDFKAIFTNEKIKLLLISLLKDKIELDEQNYTMFISIMNGIIDINAEIVNNIREIYRIASPDKLRDLIYKHFIPSNDEKKKNAEVPTPVKLVSEMLYKIQVDFWKKPRKVFEPCSGKGHFVLAIFDLFYKGLEEMYPDKIERCHVIMSDCIYYADINAMNVFITTEIMKCHVQSYCGLNELDYEFNSYTGDTLELNIEDKWNIQFDAIIGNPPYNDDSGNKGKGHTLWTIFIEKSLKEWLLPNGYLLFVNPSLWRQPDHPLQTLMKSKQIIYLEIHDEKDGLKTFRCNTRYDVYLIQNKPYELNTTIKTQKGEMININLSEWNFIPNFDFEIIEKIIMGKDKINILHSESKYEVRRPHMSHIKSDIYKYPCVYSVNRSNDLSFKWSNTMEKGMFNIPKVIFGSGATGIIVDKNGDYGLTQWCTGIVDDVDNLENIAKALNSNKFKDIILATSVSKAEINRKILKHFKKDFWKEFI